MTERLLDILIPTLACREDSLAELLANLEEQRAKYALAGLVNWHCNQDEGERSLGAKRTALLAMAEAKYVAFIDDDDAVADDYLVALIETIWNKDVDVITFCAKKTIDGDPETAETIIYNLSEESPVLACRAPPIVLNPPNHLCCWKREVALRADFPDDLQYGSDQPWWKALHLAGAAQSRSHIASVLYHYLYRSDNGGVSHAGEVTRESHRRLGPGWARKVYLEGQTGKLLITSNKVDPEQYNLLGEVRLT